MCSMVDLYKCFGSIVGVGHGEIRTGVPGPSTKKLSRNKKGRESVRGPYGMIGT
jgi:hypothetical protein